MNNYQKEHREEWNAYLREYRRKRKETDPVYVEKVRKQAREQARKRKAKQTAEIEALKAEIETLKQQQNNN